MTTGTMYAYDGADRIYFQKDATNYMYYFDIPTNTIQGAGMGPYGMGTALLGNRFEIVATVDGLKYIYMARHTGTEFWRTLIFW